MLTAHATVRGGLLVLDQKVDLPDATRVVVSIQSANWKDRLTHNLVAIRSTDESKLIHSDGLRFSRDQLHARD